eukprot:5087631-Karenia_brevis.AAC.1
MAYRMDLASLLVVISFSAAISMMAVALMVAMTMHSAVVRMSKGWASGTLKGSCSLEPEAVVKLSHP